MSALRHCTLVVCGAPLASRAVDIAVALTADGWEVQAQLTEAGKAWVDDEALNGATGTEARWQARRLDEPKNRIQPACVIVAPMTFNTAGKLAGGIADSQAHSSLSESLGAGVPILAVPMVNTNLWGHPAWQPNLDRLSGAGVTFMNVHDGGLRDVGPVASGTGDDVAAGFDPSWITKHAAILARQN